MLLLVRHRGIKRIKIHLLDGTYELFRSHFSQPPRTAPDGMPVGAVRGLIQSVLSLLKHGEVSHLGVAFDSEVKSFRNDIFPAYKDGSDTPPELALQFALAERAIGSLGITCWPVIEFEADDLLGSAALHYSKDFRVTQVVICSPDKDLCQVVTGTEIVCLDRRKRLVLDENGVIDKFGVAPSSIPDYLGLMGDSSDCIPGIPKWGAKASSILLARYGSIESIPEDCRLWDVNVRGALGLSSSLECHREEAGLYKMLATLRLDLCIPQSVNELEWLGVDRGLFPALCKDLGMPNLIQQVPKWAE